MPVFDICIGALYLVAVRAAVGYTTRTSLVRIDGYLNSDQYISDILRSMVATVLEAFQMSSSNKIMQDHMLYVVL